MKSISSFVKAPTLPVRFRARHWLLQCYKIDYIICRFSNVNGMYDENQRFFPLLMEQMKKNKKIKIYGKDKILDFHDLDDCVAGIINCIENFPDEK